MEMNPYQSPREQTQRRTTKSRTVARWRITAYVAGLVLSLCGSVYAILMFGTLGWLSAAAPSPDRLETIRWWASVWLVALLFLTAMFVLLLIGLWREFKSSSNVGCDASSDI
jgi:hypothetical protein